MKVHGLETVKAWVRQYPQDEVYVVGPKTARTEYAALPIRYFSMNSESILTRAPSQLVGVPLLALVLKPDFVISLSPMISLLIPKKRSVVYEHDWRHLTNPDEFPRMQRLYRRLWGWSAHHACLCICISDKARQETLNVAPRTSTVTIENGRDHAKNWDIDEIQRTSNIVTFGHHNNKRPDLVIRAFSLLGSGLSPDVRLVVLGTRDECTTVLRKVAAENGVLDRVLFPGFVPATEAHRIIASARVIVLASSDEGFGLPVAESQYFGIPCVVTSDSGVADIFGDYPIVCQPTEMSLASGISDALNQPIMRDDNLWSWNDAVKAVRRELRKLQKVECKYDE